MKKILKWLDINFEPVCMAIAFTAMTTLITAQVILRFVFKDGFAWGEEVSRFLFVWLVFLAIPYAARNGRHIGIDFIREKFPVSVRKVYLILIDLSALVMFGIFAYNSILIVQHAALYGDRAQTLNASMNWMHSAAVVGYIIIEIRLLQCLIWKLTHLKSSYELFHNVNGRYSGANDVFFVPADQRAADNELLDPEVVEEEKARKIKKKGDAA